MKIRDKETYEPPRVTIIRGTRAWRIDMRTGQFMDAQPAPSDVPNEIVGLIKEVEIWQRLRDEWDRMYPKNSVSGDDEHEE